MFNKNIFTLLKRNNIFLIIVLLFIFLFIVISLNGIYKNEHCRKTSTDKECKQQMKSQYH